jgi:uncharacterized protein (TIGR02147 family)
MSNIIIQKILWEKYEGLRKTNPSFSQRSFARKLDVSSGALSNIMQGKRKISRKMAVKIFSQLSVEESEWEIILTEFEGQGSENRSDDIEALTLEMEQVNVLSDWVHIALLSLIELNSTKHHEKDLALRLGVNELRVFRALKRLQRLELIIFRRGKWKRTIKKIKTPDEMKSLVLKRLHTQNLELAQEKMLLPIEKRDYTATTFNISTERIPAAKDLIRKFHTDMESLLEKKNADEVYKLCVQLFPLTDHPL